MSANPYNINTQWQQYQYYQTIQETQRNLQQETFRLVNPNYASDQVECCEALCRCDICCQKGGRLDKWCDKHCDKHCDESSCAKYFQVITIAFCGFGVLCCPCATTRLFAHITGCCSPNNCRGAEDPCCARLFNGYGNESYEYLDYIEEPKKGAGFSKKEIDIACVTTTAALGLGVLFPILHAKQII